MLNVFLENLKTQLEASCEDAYVELFLRDISQYKYISQKQVIVINFKGVELENPPHGSISEQKSDLSVNFYFFARTLENAQTGGVFEVFEAVRALENITVQSLKAYSYKKNVLSWEIKTRAEILL